MEFAKKQKLDLIEKHAIHSQISSVVYIEKGKHTSLYSSSEKFAYKCDGMSPSIHIRILSVKAE